MFTLHIAGLRIYNGKSVIVKSWNIVREKKPRYRYPYPPDKDPMTMQCPKTSTQQPKTDTYPVFSSIRSMDSEKGLPVSFAFFQRNYLSNGGVNETTATVEDLSDCWKPGAMDGIPPFLMNCNCV